MRITRTKWFLPAFASVLGLGVFAAEWIGGDVTGAVESLAIMLAFAAVVLLGGRSDTIRGLRGDGRDERFRQIDIQATAVTGTTVLLAILIAFMVEVAKGHSGAPYTWLAVIGGLAYVTAVAWLRARG